MYGRMAMATSPLVHEECRTPRVNQDYAVAGPSPRKRVGSGAAGRRAERHNQPRGQVSNFWGSPRSRISVSLDSGLNSNCLSFSNMALPTLSWWAECR